jgi:hypothetical protein
VHVFDLLDPTLRGQKLTPQQETTATRRALLSNKIFDHTRSQKSGELVSLAQWLLFLRFTLKIKTTKKVFLCESRNFIRAGNKKFIR